MRKFLLFIALMISGVGLINAQSTNNDDEVVKIDYMNRYNSVEGEIIVKFADNTPFGLEYDRDNQLKSTGVSNVDKVLKRYELVSIDRLCPNDDPKRELRSSKSYNGGDVVERDLSRLCLVKINSPADKAGQPEFDIRTLTNQLIEEFNAMDEVEFAEPNYIAYSLGMPIANGEQPTAEDDRDPDYNYFAYKTYRKEPYYSQQWGITATNIDELWQAYEEDYDENPNVDRAVIAILDTGVDIEHPDLADNIWTNPNEIANNSDDDGNGYKDDLHGYDFVNKTATIKDYNSHGTHCAGIAAAVGTNGKGIAGANPQAFIMPVTVMQSNGQGSISTLIEGISYAKDNGADIISMSIGTYAYSIALEQVLAQAYQNSILVAAAGNDGLGID
ncbi:MAG: S8 family serine peptidase, partial [Bacteroidales bacterium]|nr:S8 family serine peptidase [Bacteroidales bacterium]